jgi:peptide/nickel transport system permease protein
MSRVSEKRQHATVTSDHHATPLIQSGVTEQVRSPLGQAWRRFRRDRVAVCALILAALILTFSFSAPLISHFVTHRGYADQVLLDRFTPPLSRGYILGADTLGRDELTRLAYGGRVSMSVALLATVVALSLGIGLGATAGYFGGWIDAAAMRFTDVLLSIPVLFLLLFIASLHRLGPWSLAITIAAVSWMGLARLVRTEMMALKRREWVESARVAGASDWSILRRHLLPHTMPLVVVWATLAIPSFIIAEATLSFLGFGVQVPTPSWGNMLNEAQKYLAYSWTMAFIPGAMIYLTVLSINLLGNGIRDAFDPRLHR